MMLYDTIIIGAGPVGNYLSRKLSQFGYRVLVVDKKAFPGEEVCCTGILSQECLNAFGIDDSLVLRRASSAKFFAPLGNCLRLWRESPVAGIVDRSALDMSLARQAYEAGAKYFFRTQVTDIVTEPDGVRVKADSQEEETIFRAQTVVLATGFGSTFPQQLGLGKISHLLLGAQAEVEVKDIDEVEVYFDQSLAPGGFAWLVPTRDGKGLAGLLARYSADFHLKKLLNILSSQGKIASTQVASGYGVVPLRPLPGTCADRILVVGEAAGQVKPTSGGGIYYGLLCADIAAEVLHQAFVTGDFSRACLSSYEKRWRAKLGRELTIGYWARRFYYLLNNDTIDYLFRIASKKGIPELIATTEDFCFDWHSHLFLQIVKHFLPFRRRANQL